MFLLFSECKFTSVKACFAVVVVKINDYVLSKTWLLQIPLLFSDIFTTLKLDKFSELLGLIRI